MILYSEGEWAIPQAHLLDDVIGSGPRFDLEVFCESIDRLVMRAVYLFVAMSCVSVVTQWLDIALFLLWKIMAQNVELECAAERHIQDLDASANAENRQTTRQRSCYRIEFPAVAQRIHIVVD